MSSETGNNQINEPDVDFEYKVNIMPLLLFFFNKKLLPQLLVDVDKDL